jgi:hypothetical protein
MTQWIKKQRRKLKEDHAAMLRHLENRKLEAVGEIIRAGQDEIIELRDWIEDNRVTLWLDDTHAQG